MSQNRFAEEDQSGDGSTEEWTDPAVRLAELDEEGSGSGEEEEEGSVSLYYVLQAFLIPAIIVGVVVVMFIAIRFFFTGQSTEQLVSRITRGGERDQWVAAAQLGKRLQVRENALRKLRRSQEIRSSFRAKFKQTQNERLKVYLAQILGLIGNPDAAPLLEEEMRSSASAAVKVMVLKALGDIGSTTSSGVIGDHIDANDPALRQAAVDAAGKLRNRSHVPSLVERLNDPIPHVKLNAAIALSRYGNDADVPINRVVRTLVDFMDRKTVEEQIRHADFEPPSLTNDPTWNRRPAEGEGAGTRRRIERLNHVNRMRTSAISALRRIFNSHSGGTHILKPEKSRDKILDQIRTNIRSIIRTEQKTTRPLRKEARELLSILKADQNE